MTDDRDKRRLPTPPAGVRDQLARPVTPRGKSEAGIPQEIAYESSEVISKPETTVEAISRRTKDTKALAGSTLNRLESLRRDTREDIHRLDQRIDGANQKLDALVVVLGDVRAEVAGSTKQNDVIIMMLEDQNKSRERSGMIRLTERTAEIDVERETKIESVKEGSAVRAWRRKIVYKVLAVVGTGITALVGAFVAGRCG
jgi:hypothetical protein